MKSFSEDIYDALAKHGITKTSGFTTIELVGDSNLTRATVLLRTRKQTFVLLIESQQDGKLKCAVDTD